MLYEVKSRYGRYSETFDSPSGAAECITCDEEYIDAQDCDNSSTNDYIDSEYGSIEICGTTYYASEILSSMNEDMYEEIRQQEKQTIAENSLDYVEHEISRMTPGDELFFDGGISVTCIETDEDEYTEDTPLDFEGFESIFV